VDGTGRGNTRVPGPLEAGDRCAEPGGSQQGVPAAGQGALLRQIPSACPRRDAPPDSDSAEPQRWGRQQTRKGSRAGLTMSHSRVNRVEMGRLSGAERDRFLRLGGLLARAELTASQAERARDLVEAADWKPLPRLPVTYQLEPLFLHHAFNLGIAGTRLFNFETPSALPPPIGWRVLGTNYSKRQRILLALVQSFARAGIARVMLIKGAALAPLYSSPALRDMADIDMVVASADSPKACEVLRA